MPTRELALQVTAELVSLRSGRLPARGGRLRRGLDGRAAAAPRRRASTSSSARRAASSTTWAEGPSTCPTSSSSSSTRPTRCSTWASSRISRRSWRNAAKSAASSSFRRPCPRASSTSPSAASATYEMVEDFSEAVATELAEQVWLEVREGDKLEALCRVMDVEEDFFGIVFTTHEDRGRARRQGPRGARLRRRGPPRRDTPGPARADPRAIPREARARPRRHRRGRPRHRHRQSIPRRQLVPAPRPRGLRPQRGPHGPGGQRGHGHHLRDSRRVPQALPLQARGRARLQEGQGPRGGRGARRHARTGSAGKILARAELLAAEAESRARGQRRGAARKKSTRASTKKELWLDLADEILAEHRAARPRSRPPSSRPSAPRSTPPAIGRSRATRSTPPRRPGSSSARQARQGYAGRPRRPRQAALRPSRQTHRRHRDLRELLLPYRALRGRGKSHLRGQALGRPARPCGWRRPRKARAERRAFGPRAHGPGSAGEGRLAKRPPYSAKAPAPAGALVPEGDRPRTPPKKRKKCRLVPGVRHARAIVECVPNFSEGRDRAIIEAIARLHLEVGRRIASSAWMPGADANRSVYTFIGAPEAVARGGARRRQDRLRPHRHGQASGPIRGWAPSTSAPSSPSRASAWAPASSSRGERLVRIAGELGVPVYLYEAAATRPEQEEPRLPSLGRIRGPGSQARLGRMGARLRACAPSCRAGAPRPWAPANS